MRINRKKLALPAIAGIALACAIPGYAQPVPPGAMGGRVGGPPPMRGISTSDYLMKAGAGDLFERQSSELVLTTTHDPHIRDFARTMIRDHTASTNKVKAAAMRAHLHPRPAVLDPRQQAMLRDLRRARGRDRDRVYLAQQRTAHDEALALHDGYSRTGDVPALRMVAGQIAPVVRQHIAMLRRM